MQALANEHGDGLDVESHACCLQCLQIFVPVLHANDDLGLAA